MKVPCATGKIQIDATKFLARGIAFSGKAGRSHLVIGLGMHSFEDRDLEIGDGMGGLGKGGY